MWNKKWAEIHFSIVYALEARMDYWNLFLYLTILKTMSNRKREEMEEE